MKPSPEAQRLLFAGKDREYEDRPTARDITPTLIWLAAVCLAFWAGMQTEAAIANYRAKQKPAMGLYSPSAPAPRRELDCSPEGREICKVRARMERVK